ncbi:FAD/NAD(P)-binding domain-containing protein [Cutaneotrichosporon oleaginosum]|uniref:FAD/NAD(P)-binding domain-containing protein n=1 Tax=Cutaneotrichosporon oleaginosum TaxID=879819 RepID=A0A0J0XFJ0_9TREE|nr:FAD/NAD(P)-binding domain-containing protein [Cutaneotrichosporon oleaginosum]KLT39865.1 FAD/NAD(P)-binding domain-containing protein [Cutaneotrichosporon oleaginosum]TXT05462.1 hypothetical protein COLE_06782 [Cutaneotrichosporon oleaginosum]
MAQPPAPELAGAPSQALRTVAVLGVSYGGGHAAKLLASQLPEGWRVVAIDRNTHMNHVYVFPRVIALPKHAPKAFPPYTNLFKLPPAPEVDPEPGSPASYQVTQKRGVTNGPHVFVHGEISRLTTSSVSFRRSGEEEDETISFDYCIHALGASLPAPCDVWRPDNEAPGTKKGAVHWMQKQSGVIERAPRVLIVGGGALGIQFASDIKSIWPEKEVTMLHSRARVLPRYPQEMHDAAIDGLKSLGVNVVLGQRVVHWPASDAEGVEQIVRTDAGEAFTADLVLPCTGTRPHSELMAAMDAHTVNPANGRIAVRPTTQVRRFDVAREMEGLAVDDKEPKSEPGQDADLDHMFAIGDCADTTAIQAGHVSYYQGVVAVKNILKMIARENATQNHGPSAESDELETYTPTPPMLKLTLGLKNYATAMPDGVTVGEDGVEDLQARVMWGVYHADDLPDEA